MPFLGRAGGIGQAQRYAHQNGTRIQAAMDMLQARFSLSFNYGN